MVNDLPKNILILFLNIFFSEGNIDGTEIGSPVKQRGTPASTRTPRVKEDTRFFGPNFNLEALAEVASQQRSGLSKLYRNVQELSLET